LILGYCLSFDQSPNDLGERQFTFALDDEIDIFVLDEFQPLQEPAGLGTPEYYL